MRRIATFAVLTAFALAACGGSDSSDAESVTSAAPADTVAPTDAPATDADTAPDTAPDTDTDTDTDSTEAGTDAESGSTAGAVAVSLVEWAIEAPTDYAAGTVTFDVSNGGSFPHHLAIARGDSYETLPQIGGGAVDEATLGADFLGRTPNMPGGGTETISFDLEPGNYVLFCNIAGSVSHAAQGQVLSITVS